MKAEAVFREVAGAVVDVSEGRTVDVPALRVRVEAAAVELRSDQFGRTFTDVEVRALVALQRFLAALDPVLDMLALGDGQAARWWFRRALWQAAGLPPMSTAGRD